MKKLLVILIATAGLNAYAGPLKLTNNTTLDLGVVCQPSGTSCDVLMAGNCTCAPDDTVMDFGYGGNIVFTATFANGQSTPSHVLGFGDWEILKDTNDTSTQNCEAEGNNKSLTVNFSDQ